MEKITEKETSRFSEAEIDSLWQTNKKAAEDFFEKNLRPSIYKEENKEKCLKREEKFFKMVLAEIAKAAQENPDNKVKLLFDIDETIGRAQFSENGREVIGTLLRPSLLSLLEYIKSNLQNIEFGILSTRGVANLKQQLEDPKHLAPIKNFLTESAVYSTEEVSPSFELDDVSRDTKFLKNHPLIDLEKTATVDAKEINESTIYNLGLYSADFQKLAIIQKISQQEPKTAIIPVDDYIFPKYIKRGVYLKNADFRLN